MFQEILSLLQKDARIEWRQRYAINGIILYLISTIFICYLSFRLRSQDLAPVTWNALFWIIILFTALSTVSKSFVQEPEGTWLYYYTLASPQSMIASKIIYNTAILWLISFLGLFFYSIVLGNPIQDSGLFVGNLLLGSYGFSATLSLISGIAAKTSNSGTLMAVLSFPILLPMLLLLIRVSKNAIDGLAFSVSEDSLINIVAINLIVSVLSYILFPFLWKS